MVSVDCLQTVQSESSSKGNQLKFYNNGIWIKLDNHNCFEGLAEEFVSMFEQCIIDFPSVQYKSERFEYRDNIYTGCYSYSMYDDSSISFISLRKLFRANNISLNIFIKSEKVEDNIINVVNTVHSLTGLDISQYLFKLLFLDALIINEDRHYMNLGIVTNGKSYGVAQCFDNGASLFCTNWTYKQRKSLEENIAFASSVARPFSKFFDKQVTGCITLGAKPLLINKRMLDSLMMNYHNSLYSDELNLRIKSVLSNRLDYYYNKGVFIYV